jgi:hypothetical protein
MTLPIAEPLSRDGKKLGDHFIGFNHGKRDGRYLIHMRAIRRPHG